MIAESDAAKEQLTSWYQAKPVVALMGEYSAGKSTLLNFLVAQNVAPTQVTATNLPPIWLTRSKKPSCKGLRGDGKLVDVDLTKDTSHLRDEFLVLRIGVNAPQLDAHDIIDTPGISDPNLAKGALRFLAKYLDFVIWCSAINQAWRQTEKAAWLKLSKAVRDESILVLTRADKLRPDDVDKVVRRVRQETTDLFADVLPLQTPKAIAVAQKDRVADAEGAWAQSGALALMTALERALETATKKCASRQEKQTPIPAKSTGSEAKTSASGQLTEKSRNFMIKIINLTQNDRLKGRLQALIEATKACEEDGSKQRGNLAACFDLLDETERDPDRIVAQVEAEFAVLSQQEWVHLDVPDLVTCEQTVGP